MAALLEIERLAVRYAGRNGVLNAVDDVSFTLERGETLGLVGESGCGKSSLARAVTRLVEPAGGAIRLDGVDITHLDQGRLRPHRARMQMVFQDPGGSLDPRLRVGRSIEEPLEQQGVADRAERSARVAALMEAVGLHPSLAGRLPHEFSGGQRQRIAIARAIAVNPPLIVCDEPVSALDVSLQAQILNLLTDLQQARGMSYLFISHDLSVVQHVADRVAVMYLGRIVEIAGRMDIWRRPAHPYTRALIQAVPAMDPAARRIGERAPLAGDLPNPFAPPPGCRFHTRCPVAVSACGVQAPALREIAPGHAVACHLEAGPTPSPGRLRALAPPAAPNSSTIREIAQ